MSDEIVTEVPASSPSLVDQATHDARLHAALPGVEAPLVAYAPGGHLHPAPVNTNPVEVAQADPEPEVVPEPAPEPAAPEPVREPAPEPARDGEFFKGLPPRA
jgi:hypothetical protein